MILHVDGDGFFAACEMSRRPDLKGKPVVVGEERGIACAMSYEAKALGITRAMPIFKIKREFPDVVILPSHFELYEMYSEKLYRVLCSHFGQVEWYSIDECFAEIPASYAKKHGSWEKALMFVKQDVQKQLGITFSFGLSSTKVLAKIASKIQKPDGCVVLLESDREDILKKTKINSVWGIGWRLSSHFMKMGIMDASSLVSYPVFPLKGRFGEPVVRLWYELQGIRKLPLETHSRIQKSLQATRSFTATKDKEFIFSELSRNLEILCRRLRRQKLFVKTLGFYLKTSGKPTHYFSADVVLETYTQSPIDTIRKVRDAFDQVFHDGSVYRSTGAVAYAVVPASRIPQDLFGIQKTANRINGYLEALDTIEESFGYGTISLGSSLRSIQKRREDQVARDKKDSYIWNLPLPYLGEVS
jgi:DNA polymerase-4/DNA polymerase V